MMIATKDLSGVALDWAVAAALGGTGLWYDTIATWWIKLDGVDRALSTGWAQSFMPSTDWSQGGPIIERAGMNFSDSGQLASIVDGREYKGDSHLISGMRCYVANMLGEEVEIPEGLK
jgi:hypothetical protein